MSEVYIVHATGIAILIMVLTVEEIGLPQVWSVGSVLAVGIMTPVLWLYSPMPNSSGFGGTHGGGYWGFRQHEDGGKN